MHSSQGKAGPSRSDDRTDERRARARLEALVLTVVVVALYAGFIGFGALRGFAG